MFDLLKNWVELLFLTLMIIGILIALSAPSAIISYIIIFLSGMFAGRLIYERKNKITFPYLLIIIGFVLGYLLGVYYGSKRVTIALFILGAVISYRLYDKKILRDVKY